MNLIQLDDYALPPAGEGHGLAPCSFSLATGDVGAIHTTATDDAYMFLRGLATLAAPTKGRYHYKQQRLDFSDYRNLLRIKRRIGYIAPDSGLISNRTVRENLLLMRYYEENSLNLTLDDEVTRLCDRFNLATKLDLRPGQLSPMEFRTAVAIREVTKPFEVLLLDRPEDIISHDRFEIFTDLLHKIVESRRPVVFFSKRPQLTKTFATCLIQLSSGSCLTATVKRNRAESEAA